MVLSIIRSLNSLFLYNETDKHIFAINISSKWSNPWKTPASLLWFPSIS